MSAIAALVVIGFLLSLPLRWFQNYWMNTTDWDRPPVMRSGITQMSSLILTFLLTYGGMVGIYLFFGIWPMLIALAARWWVGSASWKLYFDRQVSNTADYYYRRLQKFKSVSSTEDLDSTDRNYYSSLPNDFHRWDDSEMRREAYQKALNIVREMRLNR